MADDKKPAFKDKPAPTTRNPIDVVIVLFVLVSIVGVLVANIDNYLSNNELTFFGLSIVSFQDFFFGHSFVFKFISIVIIFHNTEVNLIP